MPSKRRPGTGTAAESFAAAVAALFDQRFAGLHRYLQRLSGDTGVAEDIAQETFCRLFDRGALPDEPVAWLIAVASNLLRDDRRTIGRRLRLLQQFDHAAQDGSPVIQPDAMVLGAERRQQVRLALERLSFRDRQLLLLRHSGFSYREIAGALEIPETSVGTTLLRAGAAFRVAYQELHGEPD